RGLEITDGQRKILAEVAAEMRAKAIEYRRAEAQLRAKGDQQMAKYDAQAKGANRAKLAPLEAIRKRTHEALSLEGRALWFERMNANARHPPAVCEALGRIHFELLAQRATGVPSVKALEAVEQAVVQLAGAQGLSPEALTAIAEQHVRTQSSDKLPKIF